MSNPTRKTEPSPGTTGYQPGSGYVQPGGTVVLQPRGPRLIGLLFCIDEPAQGQLFRIDPSYSYMIGRDYGCDIIIDESAVSAKHARVRYDTSSEQPGFIIHDMDTANHTYVNGSKVIRQRLEDNDRIKLGRVQFIFKIIDYRV